MRELRNVSKLRQQAKVRTRWRNLSYFAWSGPRLAGALRSLPGEPTVAHFRRLRELWGNPSAADPTLLMEVWERTKESRCVLECGTGLTTLVIAGALSRRGGGQYLSIDHDNYWASTTRRKMARAKVDPVGVSHSPLADFGTHDWYSVSLEAIARLAPTVIVCDGPPREVRGGRYGLIPCLAPVLEECTILLDDANRQGEQDIIKRWEAEFSVEVSYTDTPGEKRFACIAFRPG